VLNFIKGANQGTTVELDEEKTILGRSAECTIVLNVPAVSREHAVIRRIQGKFYIEDLKSRNGTFVNNQEVASRTLLKDEDRIKICDNLLAYFEKAPRPPLPDELQPDVEGSTEEEEHDSSTVEAMLPPSSKQVLVTQPSDKLAMLLDLGTDLAQTLDVEALLPKVVDNLFQVFRQADRGFIILEEEGRLIPKVIKTRRADDESEARFSRRIVKSCIETGQAILSEDASADQRFDLSQSIADCKIRSVMCVPLVSRTTGKAFGVVQVHTHNRLLKFTQDDLRLLLSVAGQAAVALENARLHESMVARAGLERDLRLAHQVQLSFLPKAFPQTLGYEFWAHYESASEVGGDYYDFIPLPGGRFGVMIGDVAGKGVSAALLMAKVSSDARFTVLTENNLAGAIGKLNDLMQEAGMLDRFVTLGAGLLDLNTHEVTFVNAGHLPPLIYRRATKEFEEPVTRDLSGLPLGVSESVAYDFCSVTLEPGDSVMLFTDGVTEAKNRDDADFMMAGVRQALRDGPMTPKTMGERLVAAVKMHSLGCKQYDDLTIVSFGRKG
jgi:serine phosphatase RsbU (regulator of sigma subunit)/pSer/pThr/pTyr-binding forkhead associated (FHA) protein